MPVSPSSAWAAPSPAKGAGSCRRAARRSPRPPAAPASAEQRMASLEPGKWADFILIDRDPTAIDPQSLAATQVIETWVAGKKVWQRVASAGGLGERGK